VRNHAQVLAGEKSADQLLDELIGQLSSHGGGGWHGIENGVSLDAWEQYYTNISNLVECDLMFEQMVRKSWSRPVDQIRSDRNNTAIAARRSREDSAAGGARGEGAERRATVASCTAADRTRVAAEVAAQNRVQRRRDWARKAAAGRRGPQGSVAKAEMRALRSQERQAGAGRARYLSWAAKRVAGYGADDP
jgi:hypothetical protein